MVKAVAAIIGNDAMAMSCQVSMFWVCWLRLCSAMYAISMVPEGITSETCPFEVSMSSGTLLRLMIEAVSGRVMVVFVGVVAVKVQYLPVFEVKSAVK